MNRLINILILLTIILTACNNKNDKAKTESDSSAFQEKEIREQSKILNQNENEKIFKSIQAFALNVLKENERFHSYELTDSDVPKHIDIFSKNGLEKITAYSDKRYPKNTEPYYYEHFTLFVLRYESSEGANLAYNKLKSDSEIDPKQLDNLNENERKRIQFLFGQSKPGGLICQKEKFIFSLVETCRDTPIGGTWPEYENLFLNYIIENDEEIKVLNADCGQMRYREEERKPAHNST